MLELRNLNAVVRRFMLEELEHDIAKGNLYISSRLNTKGTVLYPGLLRLAILDGHDESLACAIHRGGLLNATETRRNGVVARVPVTAAETLAEGEFNRFYIRGVCRHAIDCSAEHVVVYRAKDVMQPRSDSQCKLGECVSPHRLLEDLRTHPGVDTALGLPSGPNSGLSVCLP